MNVLYSLIISSLAGLSTLIGALFIFVPINPRKYDKFITLCLAFSFTIILGISIFDLLPDGFKTMVKSYSLLIIICIIFIAFITSFLLLKIINLILRKIDNNLYKLGIISMIILMVHNFPEGIITFLSSLYNVKLGIKLSIAIAIHNIPEGISIAMPIYYSTKNRAKAILYAFISGLAEPLGALLSYMFIVKVINNNILAIILIMVAFLMINLAIEEIYPKINKAMIKECFLGITSGLIIIFINSLL
ncbi:MAG: ZIP family metal transporter [Bacilli bacterium]|nr:ZIP family metal transporter [Bacilli bacterium]